jgi:serine/threonine-protein kinase HipA
MDKAGSWSLSPAFDMTFAYEPDGDWTAQHQMTLNGKRDGFSVLDFERCAESVSLKRGRAKAILDEVQSAVAEWPAHAKASGIDEDEIKRISAAHRLDLPRR